MNAARDFNPRAALLRDESGAVVGATCGDTSCWHPPRPGNYESINQDGDEIAIPCRDCPGCREFYRRYLARRLYEHFKTAQEELWELQIACGLSAQSNVCSRLQHSAIGPSLRGWCRAGADGVVLIVEGANRRQLVPRSVARLISGWKRIRMSRGRRAFASITAGMVRARAEYGEQVNRFYFRGVKPLPREFTWSRPSGFGRGLKSRVGGGALGHSIRARRDGISVHMPEAINLALLKARGAGKGRQRAGVGVGLASIVASAIPQSHVIAAPRSGAAPTVAEFRDTAALQAEDRVRARGRGLPSAPSPSIPQDANLNSIKGGGYSSSRHLVSDEFAAWAVRAAAKARKSGRIDDG